MSRTRRLARGLFPGLLAMLCSAAVRIGISNARPVQGCPPPVARNRPQFASKLGGRVVCVGYSGRQ